ncbi:hypothetical protein Tco_0502458 [Tanacetum coccineum]
MSFMGELTFFLGLQVMQRNDEIFISQDKYVADILKNLTFLRKNSKQLPMDFRYLKGPPKLGPLETKNSPFDLEAFSDSDYARASLDRKSTTGGCQFLDKKLSSWQCKKQTIVASSTTKAKYVAAANCCGQHIEIRHHFIRVSYEKKLIQVIKIHIDHNVADLLTKAFDVSRFNFLIAIIGLLSEVLVEGRLVVYDLEVKNVTKIVSAARLTYAARQIRTARQNSVADYPLETVPV